ncbi:MAG TPA: hypothetical protein VIO60_04180 [Rectinemataceae bacterium]
MKLTSKHIATVVVGVFVLGIGGASLLGYWKTTSTKQPVLIKTGEFAGMPNPSDIRGSYTWNDVAKAFGFDVKLILEAFGAKDPAQKVNTLETIYGEAGLPEGLEIGTDSVRLFVSLLTGLPHTPEESTILPAAAVPVLRASGKADPALIDAAAAKAFDPAAPKTSAAAPTAAPAPSAPPAQPAAAQTASPAPTPASKPVQPAATSPAAVPTAAPAPAPAPSGKTASAETPTEHTPTAGAVTGKTTFKDLKSWGLSEEKIKSATGGSIGPDSAVVKDWASANGLTFSELKTALQKLLDAK